MTEQIQRLNAALDGRYTIERELGQGGMAIVYVAHDVRHGREVAMKVLKPELAVSVGAERFLQEIRTTANLRHPHIVPLYDSGAADGFLFYVMPLIEGESLRQRFSRESMLSVGEALELTHEIAESIAYAHERGVVHRDIKPANILLEAGHAVVTDFGIAGAVSLAGGERLTQTGMIVGTPAYMSPEQASGQSEPDPRSDLYSLACVAYEMLAGQPPFTAATTAIVMARHMFDPVPPLTTARPGLSPEIARVIEQGLSKSPADRHADARAWAAALKAALEGPQPPAGADSQTGQVSGLRTAAVQPIAAQTAFNVKSDVLAKSVVVLPFANMSTDPEDEYFSDGISEDLIIQLSRVEDLRVISRTSAWQYKCTEKKAREIGRDLGVAYIMSGSVRRGSNRVRITAELVDAAGDDLVWGDTYDRELEDLFDIQSEVATSIVSAIGPRLSGPEPAPPGTPGHVPTRDLAAYDFYLRGRHHWNQRTNPDLDVSIVHLLQAVERDPSFALAHAALADAHITAGIYGTRAPAEVMPLARDASERALRLHADSAEALTSRACVAALYEWDWEKSEIGFGKATAIDPTYVTARGWFAMHHLVPHGRFEEAREHLHLARQLDPLSPSVAISNGALLLYEGELEKAAVTFGKVLETHPGAELARFLLGLSRLWSGDAEKAVELLSETGSRPGGSVESAAGLGQALAAAGRVEEAGDIARRLADRREDGYASATRLAELNVALGDHEAALAYLEEAVQARATDLIWLDVLRSFDPIRESPAFEAVRRTVIGPAEG